MRSKIGNGVIVALGLMAWSQAAVCADLLQVFQAAQAFGQIRHQQIGRRADQGRHAAQQGGEGQRHQREQCPQCMDRYKKDQRKKYPARTR